MATKRKSHPKRGRAGSVPTKGRASTRRPAKKRVKKARAAHKGDPLDALVDAAARALTLAIEPAWRPAIKVNLAINLEMAAFVAAFALPDQAEPAPIFRA